MPQINPLIQSYGNLTSTNNSSGRSFANANVAEQTATEKSAKVRDTRLFRLTPSSNQISQLNSQTNTVSSNLPLNRQSPAQQYQSNEDILVRQELDTVVGIDLFV